MPMKIMHDTATLMTLGELNKNTRRLGKDLQKVSSGMKLNSAGDGAAEYAISERMRVQIRGLEQATDNTKNASALLRVAEGGMQNIVDNLKSLKELALRSANGIYTDIDRATMQKEWDARTAEIDDIAVSTTFNGKRLLDGSYTNGEIRGMDELAACDGKTYVISKNAGDVTLTENGWYDFETGYTGHVSVAAQSIGLTGTLADSTIQCLHSGTTIRAVNLTIKNQGNQSGIRFTGGANQLYAQGLFISTWNGGEKALVNVGDELDVRVGAMEDALRLTNYGNGAALGTDAGGKAKRITVTGSGTATRTMQVGATGGAGIGTGESGSVDEINVSNIKMLAGFIGSAAGIGCGDTAAKVGAIRVENCAGEIGFTSGATTPFGQNAAQTGSIGRMFLKNNSLVYCHEALDEDNDMMPLNMQTGTTASGKTNLYLNSLKVAALGLDTVDIQTMASAGVAIRRLDSALNYVLSENTRAGAYITRMDFTASNLTTASENVTSAESTIRDTDMAQAMASYTKSSILAQAAQSMLAQANQNSGEVLGLLK